MRKLLLFFLLPAIAVFAQDPKDASSDKASVMEGLLRHTKPTLEKKLPNGANIAIWILKTDESGAKPVLAKANVKQEIATAKEGSITKKAQFNYDKGILINVDFKETEIVQNPTPSVKTNNAIFAYASGVQTSPHPGSMPAVEKFIADCAAEITILYQAYVNQK